MPAARLINYREYAVQGGPCHGETLYGIKEEAAVGTRIVLESGVIPTFHYLEAPATYEYDGTAFRFVPTEATP